MLEKEKTIEFTREMAPYAPEEHLGVYKIRRWNWMEKQVVLQKATTIIDQDKGMVDTNIIDYNAHMLLQCVTESPFELTFENIREMDPDIADTLYDELQILNNVTGAEKKDFSEQRVSVNLTHG